MKKEVLENLECEFSEGDLIGRCEVGLAERGVMI